MSQRALARKVDVGFPHISKIEAGTDTASTQLIVRISEALDADADELLLLADRLPDEVAAAVLEKRLAPEFLRQWRAGRITDQQVEDLIKRSRDR